MKRPVLEKPNVVQMRDKYPYKDSPQSLTLESEIKRLAADRQESIETIIKRLADFSGISERQIYYYRSGKCDIPAGHIPAFCKQFRSNALAMAILQQCEDCEPLDCYDIVRVATKSARETLQVHDAFLEVFDDGRVDGYERTKLKRLTAGAIANFNRLDEIAETNYQRHAAKL